MTFLLGEGEDNFPRRVNEEEEEDEEAIFLSSSSDSSDSDSDSDSSRSSVFEDEPRDNDGPPVEEKHRKRPPKTDPPAPKEKPPASKKKPSAPKPNVPAAGVRSNSPYDHVKVAIAKGWKQGIRVVTAEEGGDYAILKDVGLVTDPPNKTPGNVLRKNCSLRDKRRRFSIKGVTLVSVPVESVEEVLNAFPEKPRNEDAILRALTNREEYVAHAPNAFRPQEKATKKRAHGGGDAARDSKRPKGGPQKGEDVGRQEGGEEGLVLVKAAVVVWHLFPRHDQKNIEDPVRAALAGLAS